MFDNNQKALENKYKIYITRMKNYTGCNLIQRNSF